VTLNKIGGTSVCKQAHQRACMHVCMCMSWQFWLNILSKRGPVVNQRN